MLTAGVADGLTTIVAAAVAVAGIAHNSLLVSCTLTTSPLAGMYAYVFVVPAIGEPFTNHWYAGVAPPLTGEAVNVTGDVVAHKVNPAEEVKLTDGVTTAAALTVTITGAEVAVQPAKLVTITL